MHLLTAKNYAISKSAVQVLPEKCYTTAARFGNKQPMMNLAHIAKHLALISTLSGAVATSLALDPLNIWLLNAGALLYLYWSVTVRDWNLVAVNAGLLTIYLIGAIIRL
jgi:hypothetical protein